MGRFVESVQDVQDRYAQVAAQWARQQRAYVQSVKIYHQAHRRLGRDLRHTAVSAVDPLPRRGDLVERAGELRPLLRLVVPDEARSDKPKRLLTQRQFEVAKLISQGMTNEQI